MNTTSQNPKIKHNVKDTAIHIVTAAYGWLANQYGSLFIDTNNWTTHTIGNHVINPTWGSLVNTPVEDYIKKNSIEKCKNKENMAE